MARKPGGAYIDDLPDAARGRGYYEQRATLDEYLAFHFPAGDPLADLLGPAAPPLAERFPFALRRLWTPRPEGLALDVGTACGRVTFDLARDHRAAVGIDLSATLVRGAAEVGRTGRARYETVVEGALRAGHDVAVETAANARFLVGDALALPFPDARFDTVTALNLVDRVPDPGRALDELARVTAPAGLLVVASPYTWLSTFTPRERWLGGYRDGPRDVRGAQAVPARLADRCTLERELSLPFFIPHHARSGQLAVAHVQLFRRRP